MSGYTDKMATMHNDIYKERFPSTDQVYFADTRRRTSQGSKCTASSWKRAWIAFTESTTLHGIRHIWAADSFRLRRLIWLMLVLVGIGIMGYQIIDRIIHYRSWPANVNVKINFNDTLSFPAVTICNQNTFKATAAARDGRYRLIDAMYTNRESFTVDDLADVYNASDIALDDLFLGAAHRKEDLVVSCNWGKAGCHLDNFTLTLTDHGVCFTFNNDPHELNVTNAGIDYGLRLILNVEQYEYMPGPHGAAGVKIFIHDKDEFPMVGDLGLAIPTGSHTFVGNSLFVLKNLPPPHGECGRKKMTYFPDEVPYSTALCKIDCWTTEMAKECGCRNTYMPHIDGYPPVCTLKQSYECGQPFMRGFHARESEVCRCPIPCTFQMYEPSISYATTSSFVIDKLLANLNSDELQRKYIDAREVTHRLEDDKFNDFKKRADNVKLKLERIERLLGEQIELKLDEQLKLLSTKRGEIEKIWNTKHFINKYQEHIVRKNFLRGRDAMEERTLSHIGDAYQEFILHLNAKLHFLANSTSVDQELRRTIYFLLKDEIEVEKVMVERGTANITELVHAYTNGTQIFKYSYKKNPRADNAFIVPKKMLRESLNRTYAARKYGARIFGDLDTLTEHLNIYINLTDIAFYNRTLDEDILWKLEKDFAQYNRRYFGSKGNVYFESLEWPIQVMKERQKNFTHLKQQFTSIAQHLHANMEIIKKSLTEIQEDILPILRSLSGTSQLYLVDSSITKLEVANIVLSPKIHEGINTMKVFFQEVRSRGQSMFDAWGKLGGVSQAIWLDILTDENCQDYYERKGYDHFLQNVSVVMEREEDTFRLIREETDIRDLLGNKDRDFYSSLYSMMDAMGSFKKGTKLDSNFLRENFVFLDVFYSQLSYEQVTQQEEYPIFSLLCDIGGSMGLFLGASAMSLFELVDLFVDQSFRLALGNRGR